MTATDELRRMLDERGVEWEDNSPVPSMKQWKTSFTSFTGEEVSLGCYDEPKWIMGTMVFHTPEQAIEATLGRGTCRAIQTGKGTATCSKCGAEYMGSIMTNEPPDYVAPLRCCPNCGRKVVDA